MPFKEIPQAQIGVLLGGIERDHFDKSFLGQNIFIPSKISQADMVMKIGILRSYLAPFLKHPKRRSEVSGARQENSLEKKEFNPGALSFGCFRVQFESLRKAGKRALDPNHLSIEIP